MMRKIVLIGLWAGTASITNLAYAADWSGPYVGVNAGYTFGKSDVSTLTNDGGSYLTTDDALAINNVGVGAIHPNAFTGGVEAGYNWQSCGVVYGGATDFDYFGNNANRKITAPYPDSPGTAFTISQSIKTTWLLTGRALLGFTTHNFLFYGTGGLAMTDLKLSGSFSDNFGLNAQEQAEKTANKVGWILGVGGEYAWNCHLALKAEYLYADFGSIWTFANSTASDGSSSPFSHTANLRSNIVRLGLDYRF